MNLYSLISNLTFELQFILKTGHRQKTYRKLFRELSNLYLTSGNPGRLATPLGEFVCTTNGKSMWVALGKNFYLIDREKLFAQKSNGFEGREVEGLICEKYFRELRVIFEDMIRHGVPFKMTGTNVTYLEKIDG